MKPRIGKPNKSIKKYFTITAPDNFWAQIEKREVDRNWEKDKKGSIISTLIEELFDYPDRAELIADSLIIPWQGEQKTTTITITKHAYNLAKIMTEEAKKTSGNKQVYIASILKFSVFYDARDYHQIEALAAENND